MTEIRRLNDQERLFLTFSPPGVRWYATGAGRCAPTDEAQRPTLAALVASMRRRIHWALPRFRQRIVPTPMGIAPPAWVDDADFDVARHVFAALHPGATIAEFEGLVAELAIAPMPMDRPLWDAHLAERLEDGSAGIVVRAHHSVADGTQMLGFLMGVLFDLDPGGTPAASEQPWTPDPAPTDRELVVDGLGHMRRRVGRTVRLGARRTAAANGWRETTASATTTVRAAAAEFAPRDLVRRRSPAAALLARPCVGSRAISVHHTDLEAMRAVAHAHDATINDVAAAVVTDAMRRLFDACALPLRPLRVLVPVNLDTAGGAEEHVGFMLLPLPLGDEPDTCLQKIAAHSRQERETHRAAQVDQLLGRVAHTSRHAYGLTQHLVQSPRSAALALSNVRGPEQPLWLLGAEITQLYPVLPLGPHHDLAIGLLSYHGTATFCAIRDPTVAPELDGFGECLDAAIDAVVRP